MLKERQCMNDSQKSSLILSIVQRSFGDEAVLAGPNLVNQLVEQNEAPVTPGRVPGGHDFEFGKRIEVLIAAIQLTKSLIDAYLALRKARGRAPTPEEVVARQSAEDKSVGIAEV